MVRQPAVISAIAGSLVVFLLMLHRGSGDAAAPRRRPDWLVRVRAPWRRSAAPAADPFAAYRWTPARMLSLGAVRAQPAMAPAADPFAAHRWTSARMLSLGAVRAQPAMAVPRTLAAPGQSPHARSWVGEVEPRREADGAADPLSRQWSSSAMAGPSPTAPAAGLAVAAVSWNTKARR
jgi:hypothetical protein